jgi:[ribosomal protein S5]-alanine N-acetyltransferase
MMQLIHPELILQTQRLLLEPLKQHHAALLYPILQDPQIYCYIPQDPPASLKILEQRYQKLEQRLSPTGEEAWLNWAVRLKSSNRFVGRVEASISPIRIAEFAYVFGCKNSG